MVYTESITAKSFKRGTFIQLEIVPFPIPIFPLKSSKLVSKSGLKFYFKVVFQVDCYFEENLSKEYVDSRKFNKMSKIKSDVFTAFSLFSTSRTVLFEAKEKIVLFKKVLCFFFIHQVEGNSQSVFTVVNNLWYGNISKVRVESTCCIVK